MNVSPFFPRRPSERATFFKEKKTTLHLVFSEFDPAVRALSMQKINKS